MQFRLEAAELTQTVASLGWLRDLQWTEFYCHKEFHWETPWLPLIPTRHELSLATPSPPVNPFCI